MDHGDAYTTLWMCLIFWIVHLKMVKTVDYIVGIFFHREKNTQVVEIKEQNVHKVSLR